MPWIFDQMMEKRSDTNAAKPRENHSTQLDGRGVRGKTLENRIDDETDRKVNQENGV